VSAALAERTGFDRFYYRLLIPSNDGIDGNDGTMETAGLIRFVGD
jgi:hypothetical protein